MKHISILIPKGDCSLVNIQGSHQIFSEVNGVLARAGKPPMFKIQLVGIRKESSSVNLVLYLIEKFAGRDMAIVCSKLFEIQIERNSQSPFMIFNPQKQHEDDVIKQVQEYIEKNYEEKISVDDLAMKFGLSRRNL